MTTTQEKGRRFEEDKSKKGRNETSRKDLQIAFLFFVFFQNREDLLTSKPKIGKRKKNH